MAIASGLVYWIVFFKPAHFLVVSGWSKVYQDYLYVTPDSTRWVMICAIIALGLFYGLGWYLARRLHGQTAWAIVLIGSLVFGVLLSYIYPIDASDLFNNIMYGRIQHVYGANSLVQVPDQFKQDEFFPLVSWSNIPSVYGPFWELMTNTASRIAGDDVLTNILVFKWLPGIFMLFCIPVITLILKKQGSRHILAGVLMFVWNPVVLYEVWGNGHNDITMIFFILLAVLALLYKRYTFTILALTAGVLFKFIPILLIPAAGLISLRDLPDLQARIRYIASTLAATLLLVVLAYFPVWEGVKVLTFLNHSTFFTTSIPAILFRILKIWFESNLVASIVSKTALALTLAFVAWQSWRAFRNKSLYSFPQASFNILAFYLLVTCLWFQQWYTVWLIGLAPVLALESAQLFAILFGFLALGKQFFMFPLLIWPNPRPTQPRLEIEFALGVLGIPWILAVFLLWKTKIFEKLINLRRS